MANQAEKLRIKTERQFIAGLVRTGILILVSTIAIAMAVTWVTTFQYESWIHTQAMLTAFFLPLLIVPGCIAIIGRQNYRDHKIMLEVTRLALTDEMTGLANRRAFERDAAEIFDRHTESSRGTALFIVDIDHFKAVNDAYGHGAGDRSLVHVAAQLRRNLPHDALVARLGGEEFAILLRFNSLADIYQRAEALRQGVATSHCRVGEHRINVTISIGIGIAGPEASLGDVLSRADCALYSAKEEGRNRFAIAA